ncbi:TfoX/Sxy family protein [Flavobacterium sp. RHBU_24]|uniref:TfoX/Sxy family protein n=1 Tax=Flavobacterium sp. RHBU_24 TaxID=3391185 RepID=UPI0039849CE5
MPYNENTIQRIREILQQKGVGFYEKAMFGGICFMVDDKMLCACKIEKSTGEDRLMCRLGPEAADAALKNDEVTPMEFNGKSMKGYVYVEASAFTTTKQLNHWLQLCLDYNPFAKASKR